MSRDHAREQQAVVVESRNVAVSLMGVLQTSERSWRSKSSDGVVLYSESRVRGLFDHESRARITRLCPWSLYHHYGNADTHEAYMLTVR